MIAGSMTSHGNTLYYGDMEKFCSYNIDTDTTTVIYELATKPKEVKVFDVVVYYRSVSRQEIETMAADYVMYKGRLYIVTNRDVRVYDGKKTEIILKGEYVLEDYHDGRMSLVKYNNNTGGVEKTCELEL
jgi:lipopolysaccharide export system protein LptA